MRTVHYALILALAAVLGGCMPASDQEALGTQFTKEWAHAPDIDDLREAWGSDRRLTERKLVNSCQGPGSTERNLTQNGVNDEVDYRQCPPPTPLGRNAPLPQPWPPAQVGQRLDPRS